MSPTGGAGYVPRGTRGGRALVVAVPAAAALLLAACSTGNPSAQHSTTTTHHGQGLVTTTTTTPSTTTTAPTGTTTTTAAGLQTCQPGQLTFATGQSTGAAGTISIIVTMTNSSQVPCQMDGYPGMQLLDAQGAPITTTVIRGGGHFPNATATKPPAAVTVAPGATAAFALQYEDVPVGGQSSCPSSTRAEVTPPNAFTHGVMTLDIAPCGNGTVHVSPVYLPS